MKIHPYKSKENHNPAKRRVFDILAANTKPAGYRYLGIFVEEIAPCYFDNTKVFMRLEGFKFLILVSVNEEIEVIND